MKAIVHDRYGPPAVLELREVDMPTIADDQVLVRVHASSVNPVESYGERPGLGVEIDLDVVRWHPFEQALRQRVFYADGSVGDR